VKYTSRKKENSNYTIYLIIVNEPTDEHYFIEITGGGIYIFGS